MTSEWLEGSSRAPLGVRDDSLARAAEPPDVIEWAAPLLIT
jgi:hypothetical protein